MILPVERSADMALAFWQMPSDPSAEMNAVLGACAKILRARSAIWCRLNWQQCRVSGSDCWRRVVPFEMRRGFEGAILQNRSATANVLAEIID